jgi:predicted acyl esterase
MKRFKATLLALAALCACATAVQAATAQRAPSAAFGKPLPPAENEVVLTSFYIPMPDGTRMAADHLPPSQKRRGLARSRYPVIYHATAARRRFADTDDRSGTGQASACR